MGAVRGGALGSGEEGGTSPKGGLNLLPPNLHLIPLAQGLAENVDQVVLIGSGRLHSRCLTLGSHG